MELQNGCICKLDTPGWHTHTHTDTHMLILICFQVCFPSLWGQRMFPGEWEIRIPCPVSSLLEQQTFPHCIPVCLALLLDLADPVVKASHHLGPSTFLRHG